MQTQAQYRYLGTMQAQIPQNQDVLESSISHFKMATAINLSPETPALLH